MSDERGRNLVKVCIRLGMVCCLVPISTLAAGNADSGAQAITAGGARAITAGGAQAITAGGARAITAGGA
ncbi:MAG: hypothetical protein WD795_10115, partial [Woeseia sp.]